MLAFSLDGKRLAGASPGGTIQVWETATGKSQGVYQAPHASCAGLGFTSDGRLLAWGREEQAVCLWEVVTGKVLTPTGGHQGPVAAFCFDAAGKTLISAGQDGRISTWDIATGKEVDFTRMPEDDKHRRWNRFRVEGGTFSPDGRFLAIADHFSVALRDVATGAFLRTIPCSLRPMRKGIAFSPDGKKLAVDGDAKGVHLCDGKTGKSLGYLEGPDRSVEHIAFAVDGRVVAAATNAHLYVWDLATGKLLRKIEMPRLLNAMAFSPDGRWLASVDEGRGLRLWDAEQGKELAHFTAPDRAPTSPLRFSPDGRTLASAFRPFDAREATIHVWEVASGAIRHEFDGQRGIISGLAFSRDCRVLATGSSDGSILLWDVAGRRGKSPTVPPSPQELEELWSDLAGFDARAGLETILQLAATPRQSVELLRKHLQPVRDLPADDATLAGLIRALDDDDLAVRTQASRDLEELGQAAAPALTQALDNKPSPEVRRRVEQLLDRLEHPRLSPDLVRPLRGVEVLERIGTPAARQVLEALARGKSSVELTRQARAALERLGPPAARTP